MSCKEKAKAILLKCDIFCPTEFLRYDDEPEYRTLTGALCSIILVITICAVFMNVMVSTIQRKQIVWSLNTIDESTDPFVVSTELQGNKKFMFAVAISSLNLSDTSRYFDISFALSYAINGTSQPKKYVPLETCTINHWNVSDEMVSAYYRFNFSKFLCPPMGIDIPIQGKYTSEFFRYSQVRIRKCRNETDPSRPCRSDAELTNYLITNRYFYFNIFLLNTLINPNSPSYLTYYLEDRNYVQFTLTQGGLVNIFISRYQITTDHSIWPVSDQVVQEGGIVNNLGQFLGYASDSTEYARMVFRRASTTLVANRGYKKLDDTLSYIGGLFGFIVTALLFMKIYTEYSFEIEAGSHLYHYDKDKPIDPSDFNFFVFFGYTLYLILTTIGIDLDWPKMKTFDECRQQIQKQFDVRFLFERITFLERSLALLFNENQYKALHLHRKPTLKEAEEMRINYFSKEKIKQTSKEELEMTENVLDNINSGFGETFGSKNKIYPSAQYPAHKSNSENQQLEEIEDKSLKKWKSHLKILRNDSMKGDDVSKRIMKNIDVAISRIIQDKKEQQMSLSSIDNIKQIQNKEGGHLQRVSVPSPKNGVTQELPNNPFIYLN